ncbi:MAG: hypothetical protein QW063_02185 [Candidatus Nanoarchaeia archaeon]
MAVQYNNTLESILDKALEKLTLPENASEKSYLKKIILEEYYRTTIRKKRCLGLKGQLAIVAAHVIRQKIPVPLSSFINAFDITNKKAFWNNYRCLEDKQRFSAEDYIKGYAKNFNCDLNSALEFYKSNYRLLELHKPHVAAAIVLIKCNYELKEEICKALGVSPATIDSILSRYTQ